MAAERKPQDGGSLDNPPHDDPILLGEAILDRAREVSRWIAQRVYDLHKKWPEGRITNTPRLGAESAKAGFALLPPEETQLILDRGRRVVEEAARLIDQFHVLLEESWELIAKSRAALGALAADAPLASASLVPEYAHLRPRTPAPDDTGR